MKIQEMELKKQIEELSETKRQHETVKRQVSYFLPRNTPLTFDHAS
jgi:hypothetical protein